MYKGKSPSTVSQEETKVTWTAVVFPNVSKLELHLVAFESHLTSKCVAICQAHTAVCLFAWSVVWGPDKTRFGKQEWWALPAHLLHASCTGQNGFLGEIHITMCFPFPLHCCALHFIPFLGTVWVVVFHNVAIILWTI